MTIGKLLAGLEEELKKILGLNRNSTHNYIETDSVASLIAYFDWQNQQKNVDKFIKYLNEYASPEKRLGAGLADVLFDCHESYDEAGGYILITLKTKGREIPRKQKMEKMIHHLQRIIRDYSFYTRILE